MTPRTRPLGREPDRGRAIEGFRDATLYPSFGPQSVDQSETDNWMQPLSEYQLG